MRKVLFALMVGTLLVSPLVAEQFRIPFKKRTVTYKLFAAGDLSLEYPSRDWNPLSGAGSVLVTFAEKNGEASLVIDRTKLGQPLQAGDITDLFKDIETDLVRERETGAKDVMAGLSSLGAFPQVVRIEYRRPGPTGAQRVRQHSIPVGWYLYRVVASAGNEAFAEHEPLFDHMVTTLKIKAAAEGDHR